MKQLKFGVFDIILIVAIVAGIGLNIFGFGFRANDGGAEPEQSLYDPPAQQTDINVWNANPNGNENSYPTDSNANQNPNNGDTNPTVSMPVSDKPSSGDFGWFINGGYLTGNNLPSGATRLTDFADVTGAWKGIMLFDPDHLVYDIYAYMLAEVEIGGTADSLEMTWIYCDFIDEDGNTEVWEGYGDSYDGRWLAAGELLAGPEEDRFYFHVFYRHDGKQYAIGFNTAESGEPVYVALVRE